MLRHSIRYLESEHYWMYVYNQEYQEMGLVLGSSCSSSPWNPD